MSKVYKHADGFAYRRIANEGVIVPVGARKEGVSKLFQLSDVGDLIWRNIDGKRTTDELLRMIAAEYKVSEEEARSDLDEFVSELAGSGLIVECE